MAEVARAKMVGCDHAERGVNWVSHPKLGLCRRIIGERERLVAPMPLLDSVVFLPSIRRRRRWKRFVLEVVNESERWVIGIGLLLACNPLNDAVFVEDLNVAGIRQ
jgi:hypothetical protein